MWVEIGGGRVGGGLDETKRDEEVEDIFYFFGEVGTGEVD